LKTRRIRAGYVATRAVCLGLAAVATMVACGSSERNAPESEPPVETGDGSTFCRDFYAALCDHLELCACNPAVVANCRAFECDGPLFEGTDDAIARGTLVFDPARADVLFARLRNPSASCEGLYADVDLDSYSANTLGGVFRGTLGEGSSCLLPSSKQKPAPTDCAPGLVCLPDAANSNRCVRLAKPGEACPIVPAEPGSNCLLQQGPDVDNEFESAFDGLACVPNMPSSSQGTCATRAPNGTACDSHAQCESGRCTNFGATAEAHVCAQRIGSGSSCQRSSDCETNYCDLNRTSPLCVPQSADGVECNEPDECRSGVCEPGSGGRNVCVSPPMTMSIPLGGSCSTSGECASAYCYEGRCAPRVCSLFD
jgi:hypothetical protein